MSHCYTWPGRIPFRTGPPPLCSQQTHRKPHLCLIYKAHEYSRQHWQALQASAKPQTAEAEQKAARRREKEKGRSTYSPQSYKELLQDAVQCIEYALEDGIKRMEVDFPTLTGDSKQPSELLTTSLCRCRCCVSSYQAALSLPSMFMTIYHPS